MKILSWKILFVPFSFSDEFSLHFSTFLRLSGTENLSQTLGKLCQVSIRLWNRFDVFAIMFVVFKPSGDKHERLRHFRERHEPASPGAETEENGFRNRAAIQAAVLLDHRTAKLLQSKRLQRFSVKHKQTHLQDDKLGAHVQPQVHITTLAVSVRRDSYAKQCHQPTYISHHSSQPK